MDDRLPLTVLTGFLGSGKTTLLRRFLASPDGEGTGIVVNEFGEVGVDHHLFVHSPECLELLAKGRARRADIGRALHDLVRRSRFDGVGRIRRVVVETSGLADPAPIVAVLAEDAWLKAHVRLASVVAVVDAVAGPGNLSKYEEARRQVAICDTVVITKGDLRAASDQSVVIERVRSIAADARVLNSQDPDFDIHELLAGDARPIARPPRDIAEDSELAADERMRSFVLRPAEPVDWPAFTIWLSALLHAHGDRILRVKGLLRTSASKGALAVHGVQAIMHPPTHLRADDVIGEPSFLVFILRGLSSRAIEHSYEQFSQRYAEPRSRPEGSARVHASGM